MDDDIPFASVPAEQAYQSAKRRWPTLTRDIVRWVLQTYFMHMDKAYPDGDYPVDSFECRTKGGDV